MGKKAAAPAAPNYTALAEKTAASQNPNQATPWGNLQRTQNADGSWQQTVTLDPADQARLDAQRANQMQAVGLQSSLLGQAQQSMGTPFQSQAMDPGFGGVDALKNQYLDYVRPDMERQQSAYVNALRQRGIPINSEAWSNATRAMMDSDARRMWEATDKATNAYNDIFNRGLAADTNARVNRQLPLAEALQMQTLTGPVGMPVLPSPGAGIDYFNAGNQQYQSALAAANAQNAQRSGMISGLMGLGGSILGGPIGGMLGSSLGGMFSPGVTDGGYSMGVGSAYGGARRGM